MDVVVANDPMPSVSKNAVTKPIAVWSGVGVTRPPPTMVTRYSTSTTPRPPSSRLLASMHEFVGIGLRDVDRRASHFLHRGGQHGPGRAGAVGAHDAVGREHRHRALQRLRIGRIVVAAEYFGHPVGDLLW